MLYLFINTLPVRLYTPPGDKMYPTSLIEIVWNNGKNSDFGAHRAELLPCVALVESFSLLTKKGKVFSMLYQHYWTMIGDQLMPEK